MSKSKSSIRTPPTGAAARETQHDRRTQLVKDMMAKESAALDAKTNRLRALRLAKEAEEKAAAGQEKPKAKAKPASRVRRITTT